jgi:hypothetical protein
MSHYVCCPLKKNSSRNFQISGTLIVNNVPHNYKPPGNQARFKIRMILLSTVCTGQRNIKMFLLVIR